MKNKLLNQIQAASHRNRCQQFFKDLKNELEGDEWSGLRVDAETGDLYMYDIIGWPWVTALDVLDLIGKVKGDTITLHVNSPGGDVFEGFAIFNALRNSGKKVKTVVDGLAASAASYIAMAGGEIIMAENALMMIHDPWTFSIGNAADLRKDAEILDKIKEGIINTYATRSQIDKEEVANMMADETWMTAGEAVDQGFADAVGDKSDGDPANRYDLSVFAKAPGAKENPKDAESKTIYSADHFRRQIALNNLKSIKQTR